MTPADQMLHDAASNGLLSTLEVALLTGADLNAQNEYGDAALHLACNGGHMECAMWLVQKGADINLNGAADMTPVFKAATGGHVGLTRMLVEKGAKISIGMLNAVNLKVNILEENAEAGMVRSEAAAAWRQFLDELVGEYQKQNPES